MATQDQLTAIQLDALASQLSEASKRLRTSTLTEAERLQILNTTKEVTSTLTNPFEELYAQLALFTQVTSVRLFIKWGAFTAIPTTGSISIADLATKINASPDLLIRYTHLLTASSILSSPSPSHVAHTPKSLPYTTPNPINSMAQFIFDDMLPPLFASPAYYDRFGLDKEPSDRLNSIYAFAFNQLGTSVWDVMASDANRMANCMAAMGMMESVYPFVAGCDLSWAVEKGRENKERVILVDVGGGSGHAVKEIVSATVGLEGGRCVVEDLEEVVQAARVKREGDEVLKEVRFEAVDFHAGQPVKGALVYYVRRVLHDYGDAAGVGILERIVEAMAEDSRVLIVEQVMGDEPSLFAAASNIFMTHLSGKERMRCDWEVLTGRAGLKILQVYGKEGSDGAVIECVKA